MVALSWPTFSDVVQTPPNEWQTTFVQAQNWHLGALMSVDPFRESSRGCLLFEETKWGTENSYFGEVER